ncbi:YdeI family protein [Draconibacterium sediminis]|uniref:YdeI/OmpD-associated family protein n=1 Tax=Draconibacterium sediminis TaxID=1544798 RepID=UPI0026EEACC8|nr:DUF1801 domain-containing protein [Draconibacterium sediminis]
MKLKLNAQVDKYLIDGCMRCKYGGTPQCKVNNWRPELEMLRQIVLECGLTEELKWGVPCYTVEGKNVVLVSAFKDYASLSFFKGALLIDKHKMLSKHGESSQSVRLIKFTTVDEITQNQDVLKDYVLEAVKNEKSGKKVETKKNPEPLPAELLQAFENDPVFEEAFYALTPGRQRGYIIYFSQAKQSQTRIGRIEKYKEQILNGVGLNDKYKRTS